MTVNVNGLCDGVKREWFQRVLYKYKVDMVLVQEHKFKGGHVLVVDGYQAFVLPSDCLKRGVGVLIWEPSLFVLHRSEGGGEGWFMHVDG